MDVESCIILLTLRSKKGLLNGLKSILFYFNPMLLDLCVIQIVMESMYPYFVCPPPIHIAVSFQVRY